MSNGGFGTTFGFPNHKYCSTTKWWLSPEQLMIKELKETQLKDVDKEKKNKRQRYEKLHLDKQKGKNRENQRMRDKEIQKKR